MENTQEILALFTWFCTDLGVPKSHTRWLTYQFQTCWFQAQV